MHEGDTAIGRVTSPSLQFDAARITLKLSGTSHAKLRVELFLDGSSAPFAVVSPSEPSSDALRTVTIPIPPEKRGKPGKITLVDESAMGHLAVDDIWAWDD